MKILSQVHRQDALDEPVARTIAGGNQNMQLSFSSVANREPRAESCRRKRICASSKHTNRTQNRTRTKPDPKTKFKDAATAAAPACINK